MGCTVTFKFVFVSNCEAFEVIGTSGPALVTGVLSQFVGAQPGRIYKLQLDAGDLIEITVGGSTLNRPNCLIAFIGQATGGDATHLQDTGRNWPLGYFGFNDQGLNTQPNLVILGGAGGGNYSGIIDNTATELTFNASPGMVPDSTSTYAVVWNVMQGLGFSGISPLVFTVPETGEYTVEVCASLNVGTPPPDPYGRAFYILQKKSTSGGSVPMGGNFGSTYDSLRDLFWVFDDPQLGTPYDSGTTKGSFLCKVLPSGTLVDRTLIGAIPIGNITYIPIIDRLALVDNTSGDLVIIDPTSASIESTTAIAAAPGGAFPLCVFCATNNLLYCPSGVVIDPVAKTLVTTIAGIPANDYVPTFIAADGNIWYAPAFYYSNNPIYVVNPMTNTVAHTIAVPLYSNQGQLAYASSTGLVYGPGGQYGSAEPTFNVYDPVGYTLLRQTKLDYATNTAGIAYRPQDGLLYAGAESFFGEMSDLVVIDPATESIVSRKLCGPQPYIINQSSSGVLGLSCYGFSAFGTQDWNNQHCFSTESP